METTEIKEILKEKTKKCNKSGYELPVFLDEYDQY
jgi:hypothetical protein